MSQQRAKGKMARLSAETQSIKQAVARAVASQSRQITAQEKRKRKRRAAPTGQRLPMGRDPLGLFADQLRHYHMLPSSNSQPSGYDAVVRTYRTQPIAGAAATPCANGTSFLINPWYTFTDYISYFEMLPSGTRSLRFVPTNMVSTVATTKVFPDAGQELAFAFDNSRVNVQAGASNSYTGHVRVLGVEIDIEYTGKLVDCGGTLTIFHGGGGGSGGITQGTYPLVWESSFTNAGQLQTDRNKATVVRFGNSSKWVWRPHHLDFLPVRTKRNNQIETATAAAGLTEETEVQLGDVLSSNYNPNAPVDAPYGCGFLINLAQTVAAGTPLPLIVKFRVITHENLTFNEELNNTKNIAVTSNAITTHSDTATLDKLRNTLTTLHAARRTADVRDNANPLSIAGAAMRVGEGFLNGAMKSLGDRIFS